MTTLLQLRRFISWRRLLFVLVTILLGQYFLLNYMSHVRSYLRSVWPHGYQHFFSHADLLDNIYTHMNSRKPRVFKLVAPPGDTNQQLKVEIETRDDKIPKLIHLMWKDELISDKMAPWIRKWSETNPDWTILFWTDESMNRFIGEFYQDLFPVYQSLKFPVMKADMFRYLLLLSLGGVWADLDVEPLKSLNPVREMAPCILSQEPPEHHQIRNYMAFGRYAKNNYTLACNAVMACRPGHPFIFFLLSKLTERSPLINRFSCSLRYTLWCTGPELLTQTYMFYKWSLEKRRPGMTSSTSDDVIMTDPYVFTPTFDTSEDSVREMRENCKNSVILGQKGRELCPDLEKRNFVNNPVPAKSITNHHWFHTYFLGKSYTTSHIGHILPNVKFFYGDSGELFKA